jgi:hypothetical protein
MQRRCKQAFSTTEAVFCVVRAKWLQRTAVAENWVQFWIWQSIVTEKKWQEMNYTVQRRLFVI